MKLMKLAAAALLGSALGIGTSIAQMAQTPATAASGIDGAAMMHQMMMPASATASGATVQPRAGRGMAGPMIGMSVEDDMMIERVEGRIAFLHAELKIGAAQEQRWQGFATALRANAQKLDKLRSTVNAAVPGLPSTLQQLERQERWIAARLDGVRALKTTLEPLYAAMSDDQKQRADELLPLHLGLIPVNALAMTRR
ncbi:MAG TPA: Spy/CpxP family protein refolding chaperone [Alphaproteobacteria bacterium]